MEKDSKIYQMIFFEVHLWCYSASWLSKVTRAKWSLMMSDLGHGNFGLLQKYIYLAAHPRTFLKNLFARKVLHLVFSHLVSYRTGDTNSPSGMVIPIARLFLKKHKIKEKAPFC